jgi:hypothetical protein
LASETVFYFDVLGFSGKAGGDAEAAVDALTDLAALLGTPAIAHLTGPWASRYALSDSVFLTHESAETAIRQAATLVFNLINLAPQGEEPPLVRGGLASGEVKHVKGIFLESSKPANLVGQAVVDAVALAESSGLKGPRIFLSESLARSLPKPLVAWLLRPTSSSGVWEVLWPLPAEPSEVANCAMEVKNFCDRALKLLRTHGGNAVYGAHYRELLLLLARSIERIARFEKGGGLAIPPMAPFLIPEEVRAACESISGLPEEYVAALMRLVEP